MIKVTILKKLVLEIKKKFNKVEANKIIDLLYTLQENPNKGKLLGSVGGLLIKEIRYKNFRFYFVTDGHDLMCYSKEELCKVLIQFVRMSDKKHQQQTINEIKHILLTIGPERF